MGPVHVLDAKNEFLVNVAKIAIVTTKVKKWSNNGVL